MSNQNFKTYKLACQYNFFPKLSFYDHMNKLGDVLFRDYKHWSKDSNKIELSNFTNRTALLIEHNRLLVVADTPSSPDILTSRFSRAWKEYYSTIKPDSFRRLGLRIQGLVPIELNFNELLNLTHSKLFNTDSRLTKLLGSDVQDYMYNVQTTSNKNTTHLICGPIRDFEIPKFFKPAGLVLDAGEEPPEITYPTVGFWIDCDFYCENPDSEAHKSFLDTAVKNVTTLVKGLTNYLFGV